MPKAISTTLAAIPPYWKSLRISLCSLWLRWLVTATIRSRIAGVNLRGSARSRCGELPARPRDPPRRHHRSDARPDPVARFAGIVAVLARVGADLQPLV